MKMRHAALILFFSILGMLPIRFVAAQTPEQIVRMVESNRTGYYYGHGYADDYEQALQKAKGQLVSDISVYVKSNTTGVISTEGNSMEERIHTYTNMTQLREVETVVLSTEPKFHVFCYLTKSAVKSMFEERKSKMFSYFEEARRAEQELKMAEALRYYYWSLLVLKTLPDDVAVTFVDDDQKPHKMLLWLNTHIPEMLDNITFTPLQVTGDDKWKCVEVAVTYKGTPVADCEYRYWTGRGYSQNVLAKDGRGIAEFSEIPEQMQFYVEYVFANDARNVDAELRDIVQMGDRPSWKNNAHTVPYMPASAPAVVMPSLSAPSKAAAASKETENGIFQPLSAHREDSCIRMMDAIRTAVRSKNYSSVSALFTEEGMEMFRSMMESGNAVVVREPQWNFRLAQNDILCRGLTVSLKYPRSGKTIVQDVEFRLNVSDLKVNSLSYTLTQQAEADILSDSKKWSPSSRLLLMRFLQDYQTAYALKRADYLDDVFSDDALIVVGTELKRVPDLENKIHLTNQKQYRLVQKTKAEFIAGLRRVFASAEFVNLQFVDNQILKVANKEIYGIQIKQIYTSNNYADEGYLFLVVDLRNPESPVIHVRTWQPDKDPEFGLFDLSKFSIN